MPGNKIYTCKVPSNWEDVNHLKADVSGLGRFSSERGEIVIDTDMIGSLMADMSRAVSAASSGVPMPPGLNLPAPKPVIEDAHDMDKKKGETEFKNYHEDEGRTWTGPFGEERFSEFTGEKGMIAGDMHGYRATMLTRDKRVTIWCWCPESDWTTLKSVFGDVINSVSPGTGTG